MAIRSVSRFSGFCESWEEFWSKLNAYSPNQLSALVVESRWDSKIALIVGCARPIVRAASVSDRAVRADRDTRRTAAFDTLSCVRDYSAPRQMIASDAARQMHAIPAPRRTRAEKEKDADAARRFWRALDAGKWRGRSVVEIVSRIENRNLSALSRPYGPPVPEDVVEAFEAQSFRRRNLLRRIELRVARERRHDIRPSGMTYQRALEIAIESHIKRFEGGGVDR